MLRSSQPRLRRLHALVLCVLWLVGFELGPGAHIAFHELLAHHHHDSADHVDVDAHDHEHALADEHEHAYLEEHEHAYLEEHEHEHEHAYLDESEYEYLDEHAYLDEHEHIEEHEHGEELADAEELAGQFEPAPVSLPFADDPEILLAEDVARCADDFGHGTHALAHRGIAAMPTPPAWPPVAVAPWAFLSRTSCDPSRVCDRTPSCTRARGPPV